MWQGTQGSLQKFWLLARAQTLVFIGIYTHSPNFWTMMYRQGWAAIANAKGTISWGSGEKATLFGSGWPVSFVQLSRPSCSVSLEEVHWADESQVTTAQVGDLVDREIGLKTKKFGAPDPTGLLCIYVVLFHTDQTDWALWFPWCCWSRVLALLVLSLVVLCPFVNSDRSGSDQPYFTCLNGNQRYKASFVEADFENTWLIQRSLRSTML